jgi:hypothetical protein
MIPVVSSWLAPAWDWFTPDKVIAIATIVYAAVTVVMFFAIRSQAKAARDAAKTAKKSVDALIMSLRAEIIASPTKPILGMFVGGTPKPCVHLLNTGTTTAYKCIHQTWIELLPYPLTDFTSAAVYKKAPYPMTIYANSQSPPYAEISLERPLTVDDLTEMKNATKYLCFRIRVEYIDAFKEPRYADFAFTTDGIGVGAFPKYNDSN